MANPSELARQDIRHKYDAISVSSAFERLYPEQEFGHMFAVLHMQLNSHFESINDRARTTRHYWADPSRQFLALIDEIASELGELTLAGVDVQLAEPYRRAIEQCEPWLSHSGGSTIPDDFVPIRLVKYEPVFTQGVTEVALRSPLDRADYKMIGEGSYAHVYAYVDPAYGKKFAVKRAKRDLDERELFRFKQEFDVMKRLSFPYVLEVYKYDSKLNEYRMEYCDETLREFIARRNGKLSFASRKRVALQFLYGVNYIHRCGLLHRDISLQNVLVKVFGASNAVLVKLSDFGLVKDAGSEFTRTQTDMRGRIRDPILDNFKNYSVINEIYSIGWVLSYIFTGKEALQTGIDSVGPIIQRCVSHTVQERYSLVPEVIADVEKLASTPTDEPA